MSELHELPDGWEWNQIDQLVFEIHSGFACSKKFEVTKGHVHLRTHNISTNGKINLKKIIYIPDEKVEVKKSKVYNGDILFNNTNSVELVGKTALVEEDANFAYSNHITHIKVNKLIEAPYLVYYLQLLHIQKYFERICKRWIGQAGVNNTILKKILIPLASLKEQKRIVSKLDTLFEKIDKAIALHQKNMDEADVFMGSVLNEVFEEFDEKYSREMFDDIKISNTIGLVKNVKEQSISLKYQYVKMNNITRDNRFTFDNMTNVDATEGEVIKFALEKGDFLFNTRNSAELVGKSCIFNFESNEPILYNNNIMRVRFRENILSYFIAYQFGSYFIKDQLENIKSATTNVAAIYYKGLRKIDIITPPLLTQQEVVIYLDQISEKTEKIKAVQKEKMESLKALKASLLDRAFRGEL